MTQPKASAPRLWATRNSARSWFGLRAPADQLFSELEQMPEARAEFADRLG